LQIDILSFCLRDNSVHLHEWSPFWVDIFIICLRKLLYLLFDVDMCILIGTEVLHLRKA